MDTGVTQGWVLCPNASQGAGLEVGALCLVIVPRRLGQGTTCPLPEDNGALGRQLLPAC